METSSLSITGDIERASPFKVLALSKIARQLSVKRTHHYGKMNKNGGKRIKMSLYTVGTLFRKGRISF